MASPEETLSPTFFIHLTIFPSFIVGERLGSTTVMRFAPPPLAAGGGAGGWAAGAFAATGASAGFAAGAAAALPASTFSPLAPRKAMGAPTAADWFSPTTI